VKVFNFIPFLGQDWKKNKGVHGGKNRSSKKIEQTIKRYILWELVEECLKVIKNNNGSDELYNLI
jgi:hypothetical protein